MPRRPRPGRLFAAGLVTISVIVGCGGPSPSTSPETSLLPGPSGSSSFPTAPPSTGVFVPMKYPAEGPAPCEEPASADPAYGPYAGSLRRVFARDASTVVFELCDADAAFLSKIASPALAIDDTAWLQSHIDPTAQQQPILTQVNGTGPFRLDGWDGSGDITLSRSDSYWGTPALTPSIIFVGEKDAGQRLSKLREGSVDAVDELAPGDVEAAGANPDLTLTPREGLNTAYIGFNNRFAPFDNETVRRAIAMGIDRSAIVDAGFPAGAKLATHFLPCAIPAGCGGDPWPEMDPEAARDLLADVGMADGFTSTISFPNEPRDYLPDPTAAATALQSQLKDQLGITTTLNPMPLDDLVAAADSGKLEGFYLLGARARYPDAGLLLESHFGPAASLQFGNRFDDIARWLGRGRSVDAKARAKGYAGVNGLIRKHVPMIPLAHVGTVGAFRTDVTGKQASATATDRFATVVPGDRTQFVYMQKDRPASLFCADETDDVALRICAQLSESLYRHDMPEPGLSPSLAKACTPDADLTVWTCTLRDGVTFHDGSTLDANDVVLSYAIRWDAAHPLHRGRQGTFQAFVDRFGGFLHPPVEP
ncbi:MAG TPA: ABC transporter substrate-binding protein [Candidatus Limnocylindrales bacterium]|nr:ABC transporter substrate-binding protein [Candidatus Limnocylindrales bacterium]